MKQDSRTDLQKINDYQNYKYLSILVAVKVIAASIFYLLLQNASKSYALSAQDFSLLPLKSV